MTISQHVLVCIFALFTAAPVCAQITVPNTFTAGETIRAADINTNFSTIAADALNRLSGGNLSGNVTADPGITIDGIDLSATVCPTCTPTFQDLTLASPATGLTVAGVNIVNSTGKIPALSSTYFSSLAGTNLTALPAGQLTGALPALDGSALTNLSAANLTGIIPNGALPGVLPALVGTALTFLNPSNISAGTAGISISGTAPANQLTGTTLASTVVNSNLTSVGTLLAGVGVIGPPSATVILSSAAYGTTKSGPGITIGRNSSGGGSPATVTFLDKTGAGNAIWVDSTGNMRIGGTPTETSGDTVSGVVVGTQTSTLDTKNLLGNDLTPSDALTTLLHTPVMHFSYKSGAMNGSEFQGIIADWSPEFAMDPDAAHPTGRSFNPVSAFGYTVETVKALQSEIDELKAQVAVLLARP